MKCLHFSVGIRTRTMVGKPPNPLLRAHKPLQSGNLFASALDPILLRMGLTRGDLTLIYDNGEEFCSQPWKQPSGIQTDIKVTNSLNLSEKVPLILTKPHKLTW